MDVPRWRGPETRHSDAALLKEIRVVPEKSPFLPEWAPEVWMRSYGGKRFEWTGAEHLVSGVRADSFP